MDIIVIYLFTFFSGHWPDQRESARTGLRAHARCHPYPIPQPVKVGYTTGDCDPYSFRIVMWILLLSQEQISEIFITKCSKYNINVRQQSKRGSVLHKIFSLQDCHTVVLGNVLSGNVTL